ncbi:hypothetical protein OIE66_36220 [Nonomuraea sp. NBC_01738]|uniref:nuclear transport factor 2 family protein n=1 Tax=Nonomuraea sp. NBC_01738 TaxID=2976003 RepID=UPI002E15D71E|nr:hypothetical protein OIE66_36220 [Nonomuraea sp. NBC_01738]
MSNECLEHGPKRLGDLVLARRTQFFQLQQLPADGDAESDHHDQRVIAEHSAQVRVGDTPATIPGLLIFRIRDGRIVHTRDYMDATALSRLRAAR